MHQQAKFNRTSSSIGKFILLFSLAAGGIAIGIKTLAVAQPTPPAPVSPSVAPPAPPLAAPPAPAPPPAAAPAYSSNFSGTVKRYLLNPEGQVDGLLLSNGLQVKFPPHMAKSLSAAVKPGNNVTVMGVAYSITNTQTRQTVVDQPPLYPPQPPTSRYENLSVEGTAQTWLVGGRGEINGVILSSGAQVRFPPYVGYQLANQAQTGARIKAQGFGSRNQAGQVLETTSLSVNGRTIPVAASIPGGPLPPPR